ncbi:hypothetical protein AMS68_000366 [Peltaster fructicola]|uniref:Uncharacterized protein n=1 Tax=Peltaster fructicola TaxID=286661 RepID=A0A6H0XJN4_9PEZI|nr:hypothetical protein AMS68_000366 [Peltaster fructicola]
MQRRSSQRTPRKKYTTDAFASIPELRDGSEEPDRTSPQDDASSDDFVVDTEPKQPGDESSESEPTGDEENVDVEDGDASDYDDDAKDDDDEAITASKHVRTRKAVDDSTIWTRGLPDGQRYHLQAGRGAKRQMYWGGAREDLAVVQKVVKKWIDLPVLPSQEAGFHRPFLKDSKTYEALNDQDWSWCCDAAEIMRRQVITPGQFDEVKHLLPTTPRAFLIGAVANPKQCMLSAGECMSLQEVFTDSRNGFVINTGERIQCLDWIPDQPGPHQYLAVATTTKRPDVVPCEDPDPPAFTPSKSYQSLLQIWRLNVVDRSSTPRLKAILSSNFGGLKKFQFCPYQARRDNASPLLLCGLWSDGGLRVIALPDISNGDETDVHYITQTLVETKALDTIYTCFTWMSPRKIAVGCANGCIAVFDLSTATPDCNNLKPMKYAAISSTYILAIASCSPSCPNMLLSSSMDGFLRITDTAQTRWSSPSATVHGPRARTVLTNCVWHDYIRSAILTDESFGVRLHLARRIFNLFTIGRTRSTPTVLALSPCHPFLLVATIAGEVHSMNPITKLIDSKAPVWQQAWFTHEWRRGQGETGDALSEHIAKVGLSRFCEGYKPEKMSLSKTGTTDGISNGFLTNTVYEKQTAVSALVWNPNLHVGGWAAAGMADGLLRVEDLALPSNE